MVITVLCTADGAKIALEIAITLMSEMETTTFFHLLIQYAHTFVNACLRNVAVQCQRYNVSARTNGYE